MRDLSIHRFYCPNRVGEQILSEYWETLAYPLIHLIYWLWFFFFSVTRGLSENSDALKALFHGRTSLFTKHIAVPQLHCAEILQMISEVLIKSWVHTKNVHSNDYSCGGLLLHPKLYHNKYNLSLSALTNTGYNPLLPIKICIWDRAKDQVAKWTKGQRLDLYIPSWEAFSCQQACHSGKIRQ